MASSKQTRWKKARSPAFDHGLGLDDASDYGRSSHQSHGWLLPPMCGSKVPHLCSLQNVNTSCVPVVAFSQRRFLQRHLVRSAFKFHTHRTHGFSSDARNATSICEGIHASWTLSLHKHQTFSKQVRRSQKREDGTEDDARDAAKPFALLSWDTENRYEFSSKCQKL